MRGQHNIAQMQCTISLPSLHKNIQLYFLLATYPFNNIALMN